MCLSLRHKDLFFSVVTCCLTVVLPWVGVSVRHVYDVCDIAGSFVSVKGTVVRVSNIKPLCTQIVFQCAACEEMQVSQ